MFQNLVWNPLLHHELLEYCVQHADAVAVGILQALEFFENLENYSVVEGNSAAVVVGNSAAVVVGNSAAVVVGNSAAEGIPAGAVGMSAVVGESLAVGNHAVEDNSAVGVDNSVESGDKSAEVAVGRTAAVPVEGGRPAAGTAVSVGIHCLGDIQVAVDTGDNWTGAEVAPEASVAD